jgi:hypothetical protein
LDSILAHLESAATVPRWRFFTAVSVSIVPTPKTPTFHQQKRRLYEARGEQLRPAVREKPLIYKANFDVGGVLAKGSGLVRKACCVKDVDARVIWREDALLPGHDELFGPTAYADAGRCAFRKEWIWRTASGIRSLGSFHGNMLTSAFGASIAASMATA